MIEIDKIKVNDRIRKDFGDIEELANDIKENGLINPPVVTPEYELIAGERRLRAMKLLGHKQIEVRVMSVKDYEHQLVLEINENESRKDFSKLERLDYARRLEKIERIKAEKRMKEPMQNFAQGTDGKTRDIVAEKVGIGSGETYRKEKFIAENAGEELLNAWDKGDISTHKAYKELEANIKAELEAKYQEKIKDLKKFLEIEEHNSKTIGESYDRLEAVNKGNYQKLKEKEAELEKLQLAEPKTMEIIPESTKERIRDLEVEKRTKEKEMIEMKKELEEMKKLKGKEKEINETYEKIRTLQEKQGVLMKDSKDIETLLEWRRKTIEHFSQNTFPITTLNLKSNTIKNLQEDMKTMLDVIQGFVYAMQNKFNIKED